MNMYDKLRLATEQTRDDGSITPVWKSGPQMLFVRPVNGNVVVLFHDNAGRTDPVLVTGKKGLLRGYKFTLTGPQYRRWWDSWKVPPDNVQKGAVKVKDNGNKSIRELALQAIANVPSWTLDSGVTIWDNGKDGPGRKAVCVTRRKHTLVLVYQDASVTVEAPCAVINKNGSWVPTLDNTRYQTWSGKVKAAKRGKKKGQVKRAKRADNIKTSDIRVLSAITHAQWHSVHATVKSQSGSGKYMVYLRFLNDSYHAGQCTCPDNGNGNKCKHILAVQKFVNKS